MAFQRLVEVTGWGQRLEEKNHNGYLTHYGTLTVYLRSAECFAYFISHVV